MTFVHVPMSIRATQIGLGGFCFLFFFFLLGGGVQGWQGEPGKKAK